MPGILGPGRTPSIADTPPLFVAFRFHPSELEHRMARAVGIEGVGPLFAVMPWRDAASHHVRSARLLRDGIASEMRLPVSGYVDADAEDTTGHLHMTLRAVAPGAVDVSVTAPTSERDFAGATGAISYESDRHDGGALLETLQAIQASARHTTAPLLILTDPPWPHDLAQDVLARMQETHPSILLISETQAERRASPGLQP